ncbi:hypothetical protein LG34_13365 [Eubacterium ramulus]|uniref:ATP-dependent Clp protease proteolytic subunit n=1 Tax=Eubacterium ramulus TaxID=39490 RepID=A0A2V1JME2_EUBRA|nr:head maturation protease, ClpP-related [Eubacterium ramulus]PWE85862.1 hypothetical protein LG34_13365 [Eubacterium ramulus]
MGKLPKLYYMFSTQDNVHNIYLYDDIQEKGDWNWETWTRDDSETSAKHFQEELAQIPETDEICLYINSNGGSVKEGTAIYNQLKRHGAHKTGYVDGVAHSIAFVILQACDKRVMGEGTSALIHEMWVCTAGNATELRAEADKLDEMMKSSRALFMQRAKNITEDELQQMMEKETILTPDKALEYGFIDEIAGRETDDPLNVSDEPLQNIRKMKEKFQKNDFSDTLKEFEELVGEDKKDDPEDASMMDAFLNIFL